MNDFALKTLRSAASTLNAAELRRGPNATDVRNEARPAERAVEPPSQQKLQAAVEQINSYLKASSRELRFQIDQQSGEVVVRVRNASTGEVIRQIPNEEALRMAHALQENTPVLLDLLV
jgi:flagellar protein FlaG